MKYTYLALMMSMLVVAAPSAAAIPNDSAVVDELLVIVRDQVMEQLNELPEDPTCDRQEVVTDEDDYYKHTVSERCTYKEDENCLWLAYTYSYEYTAYNEGASGWREVGPFETTQGVCVPKGD